MSERLVTLKMPDWLALPLPSCIDKIESAKWDPGTELGSLGITSLMM